jgi:DnaJ-class molecular chaperone
MRQAAPVTLYLAAGPAYLWPRRAERAYALCRERADLAEDPYKILGVQKSASKDEIRKAYRRLAKELHPDVRPGDKPAEEKFKRATAAFNLLSDADKRAAYDRGELDADGNLRGPFAGAGPGAAYGQRPGGAYTYRQPGSEAGFEDLSDVFADLFGRDSGAGRRARGAQRTKGEDIRYTLEVDFLEAAKGAEKTVTMADGKPLKLKIPAGIESGKALRLRGQGQPGLGGGPAGDALVEIRVRPHPVFERDGANIRMDLPVTLKEAVLGAKVPVPTIDGPVTLTIPKNASSGATLRLAGKGVGAGKRGDQLVRLKIVLPEGGDAELTRFMETWGKAGDYDPRRNLRA